MTDSPVAGLTPVQERTLALLRKTDEPIVFDPDMVNELRARAAEALLAMSERLQGESLWVSKGFLASIHGCEAKHLGPDDFEWSPATAAGFVAHKAIELMFNWRGEPVPAQAVDEALASLAEDPSNRGAYVASLTEADRAELRSRSVDRATKFLHDFPPLPLSAHPILEAPVKWRPPGTIELSGKADLLVGRPRGRESVQLVVDFKSGNRSHHHREDLRFYALLLTLRNEVPPRQVVTYYLDYSEAEAEPVTEGMLEAALLRMVEGVERHIELRVDGRPPVKRPGVACRWCPLTSSCEEGQAHLAAERTDP